MAGPFTAAATRCSAPIMRCCHGSRWPVSRSSSPTRFSRPSRPPTSHGERPVSIMSIEKEATAGSSAAMDRIQRHKPIDRAYHWLMAAAMLILLVTAFLPILGIKFAWVDIHWITGLVLTVIVLFHIVRASFWQNFWSMMIDGADL